MGIGINCYWRKHWEQHGEASLFVELIDRKDGQGIYPLCAHCLRSMGCYNYKFKVKTPEEYLHWLVNKEMEG
jgi:hypothetical protein